MAPNGGTTRAAEVRTLGERLGRAAVPALLVGGLVLFVAERTLGAASDLRMPLALAGAAGVLFALVARVLEWRGTPAKRAARAAAGWPVVGYAMVAAGVGLYAFTTRAFVDGLELEPPARANYEAVLGVAWVLVVTVGGALGLAADWARAGHARRDRVEARRVRAAALGAASLALAAGWVGLVNVVADANDALYEWTEYATLDPSEGTLELAANLREPVSVGVFLPPASDVRERVAPYFLALDAASPNLKLELLDHALEPDRAEHYGARRNGLAYVKRGEESRRLDLGLDWKSSKKKLRALDRSVQEALLKVSRDKATLYLTVGHGELAAMGNTQPGRTLQTFRELMRVRNVTVRTLGVRQGLGGQLPTDATVIGVLGPTSRFLEEEVQSLITFYRQGGSVWLALEPGSDHGLEPLLDVLGVTLEEGVVCHEREHLRSSGGPADRVLIGTNLYGSHPAVDLTKKLAAQSSLILPTCGGLGIRETRDAKASRVVVLARPMNGSWLDLDANRQRDEGSETGQFEALALASSVGEGDVDRAEGRAVTVHDSDFLVDAIVNNAANARFVLDSFFWLSRDDEIALKITAPALEAPIRHTRDEDAVWFWSTVAGVPLLVLVAGLASVRRRRRRETAARAQGADARARIGAGGGAGGGPA